MLDIQLFGPLQATWRGKPLTMPRRQQTGLLWAYLLLHPGPVARDRAAFTLWPDHDESEARAELRRHLYFLSRWLSSATDREDWLTRARGQVAWSHTPDSAVDVTAFRAAFALIPKLETTRTTPSAKRSTTTRGPQQPSPPGLGWATDPQTRQTMAISAALYRDDLLPGVYAPWLSPIRERLQRQLLELLAALARAEHAAGDSNAAVRTARRLVERDGLREESHRLLMRLLDARGDRAAALAQFERCKELLLRELDVPPAPSTIQLVQTLRAEASAAASMDPAPGHEPQFAEPHEGATEPLPLAGAGRIAEAAPATPHLRPSSLPPSPSPLFGRADDLARLEALLLRERLVTIVGPGGVGKTAVALASAHRRASQGEGEVLWIDLTAVGPEDSLVDVVRSAQRADEGDARRESLAPTQPERLLVLDNCEHRLAEVADLAEQLLADSPALRILATSREGLRCPAELAWRLSPLAVDASAAIALFVHRARRKRPDWQPTPLDRQRMADICRRLDGLPLAIEMAAARSDTLGLQALEHGLRDSLDMLGEGARTAPPRQRTLRATFDWSEGLLEPEQRLLLARLSVFADHFDLPAAQAVAAAPSQPRQTDNAAPPATATALARLVDASLLAPIAAVAPTKPRFRLLHTIRPFALERAVALGEAEGARERHAAHFLALAEEAVAALESLEYRSWLLRLDQQRRELHAAVEHVLARGDFALALRFAAALWGYWNMRSAIGAERQWLEELLTQTEDIDPGARAPALLGAGVLAYGAGDLQRAADRCRAAQAAFEAIGDDEGHTRASAYLAHVAHMRGEDDEAAALCESSLARMNRTGARQHAAEIHTIQGLIAQRAGRLPEARERFERSLSIQRHMRWKHHGLRNALRGLGSVAMAQGQPAEAARHFEEGLSLSRELGDDSGEAVWLNELGCLRMDDGLLDQAEAHFQTALKIYRRRGDTTREAILLHNLGELALLRGAADVARLAFEHSLRAGGRPADDPRRVDTLTFLVLACAWQGDLRRAEALQAEARELAAATGQPALKTSAERAAALVAHRAEPGSTLAGRADVRAARAARSAVVAGVEARGAALALGLWRLVEQGHVELAVPVAAALRELGHQPRAAGAQAETARALARLEELGGPASMAEPRPGDAEAALVAGATASMDEPTDLTALLLAVADVLDPRTASPPQPAEGPSS